MEKQVIDFAAAYDWKDMRPTVKPDQMLGLEVNAYAAELARTALWIGYIQWHQNNGFPLRPQPGPHAIGLHPKNGTPSWRTAMSSTHVRRNGRPPSLSSATLAFLGSKLLRTNLGDDYVDAMFDVYKGRVPAEADVVCYWFEKARALVADKKAGRAGLLATQGIRGGANRRVLQHIKESGDIFLAWSDQPWILDGAAVHTSIVGFDDGSESSRELDGDTVTSINANLTEGVDFTTAERLTENFGVAFMGDTQGRAI